MTETTILESSIADAIKAIETAAELPATRRRARSASGWRHPLRGEAPRDSRAYRRSASLHFL
jgi:hypothetical protein